ncbi:hypothetical protein Tco_0753315 [Tanacetum coccineum]
MILPADHVLRAVINARLPVSIIWDCRSLRSHVFSAKLPYQVDMGLLDFIKTADPRKVRAVEVQKGDDQLGVVFCAATKRSPAPTERGQGKVLLKRMLIWS